MASAGKKRTRRRETSAASVLLSMQASGFVVTALVLIVAGVVILSPTLRILAEQRQEIAALEDQLVESQQDVLALEEQRERWKDPAFVETQARERLLFVYPGDITYLVIDDLGLLEEEDNLPISEDIVVQGVDWRESLLASYLVAATTSRGVEKEAERLREPLPSRETETAP